MCSTDFYGKFEEKKKKEWINLTHLVQYLEHFGWKLAIEYAANFAKFNISSVLCIALLPILYFK